MYMSRQTILFASDSDGGGGDDFGDLSVTKLAERQQNKLLQRSPDVVFGVGVEDGLGFPAVGLDGFADELLYVGGDGPGAVVVLVVALAGEGVDEAVLDVFRRMAGHVVIGAGKADGHAAELVVAVVGTALALHLRIREVHTIDDELALRDIVFQDVAKAMLAEGALLAVANGVATGLLTEKFFSGHGKL